jgi:hypothetical protein
MLILVPLCSFWEQSREASKLRRLRLLQGELSLTGVRFIGSLRALLSSHCSPLRDIQEHCLALIVGGS